MDSLGRGRRAFAIGVAGVAATGWPAFAAAQASPGADPRAGDKAAFAEVEAGLAQRWTDIQSVVVLLHGRPVFEFYRDGEPDKLRDVQSVEKSALSALAGAALARGLIDGVDQPVVALVPEWAELNADPRSRQVTLKHLLSFSPGFDMGSATSITGKVPPEQGWGRPLAFEPGSRFQYDNAIVPMLGALIEKVAGMPLPDFARRELVGPLGMAEPGYHRLLHLRTRDMATLGQLFLQGGQWQGRQLLPADYAAAATTQQNAGGPPVDMPYGYLWWILPRPAPRRTFMASGYSGQIAWVHPPLDMVLAATSTISPEVHRRGQVLQMLRGGLYAAAERRHKELAAR